jgi:hypothetical protein
VLSYSTADEAAVSAVRHRLVLLAPAQQMYVRSTSVHGRALQPEVPEGGVSTNLSCMGESCACIRHTLHQHNAVVVHPAAQSLHPGAGIGTLACMASDVQCCIEQSYVCRIRCYDGIMMVLFAMHEACAHC